MTMSSASTNRRRPGPGTVVALTLLPLAVLGLLLAALWQPQERLDTVRAAIVNRDKPVEVEGQAVPLGRQLASGLVSGGASAAGSGDDAPVDTNYTWEITDADQAAAGLEDGTYAAVVTIPGNFSAAATSYSGQAGEAHQATIDVATPEGGRILDDALAQVVAGTATDVLSGMLTETYIENLLVGFTTLDEQLGEAAGGASELATGAGQAASGAEQLADGVDELAEGADGLASGLGELGAGADELASGADDLAGGADQLSGGATRVADGVGASAAGARELATGAEGLANGLGGLSGGASQLANGLEQLNTEVAGASDGLGQVTDDYGQVLRILAPYVQQSAQACSDGTDGPLSCDDVATLAPLLEQAQQGGQGGSADPMSELQTAVSGLAEGADRLAGGVDEAATGAQKLAGGADELATGLDELSGGAAQLASGSDELASGASGLAEGAHGLASGVGELQTGAEQLATGTEELATGTEGLASGVGQLAAGSGELADGLDQAVENIPSYDEAERTNLASVASEPVAEPGGNGITSGASGPLFAVLALWLGALVIFVVFPATPSGALGSTRGTLRLALSAFAVPGAIGAVTGAAAGLVLAGVQGLSPSGWVGLALLGAVISMAFVAVNQALVGLLGHAGSGLSILVAILVLATGVVSTTPPGLMAARDVLPVGPAVDALAAVAFPGVGGLGGALVAVVLWALGGLAITTFAVSRRRTVRVKQLLAA
ncbi:hypothetical protein GCM10023169_03020 [Georgenia halophila]|uniref:YhgE/Pip domain-containing protein n=1 Tax=Georgenia halophila TaxID=620889 RepID=A0ABP8KUV3_9MICO